MIPLIFFTFIGLSTFVAYSNWRRGLLLMLVAAALQDPVRKIMLGTPSYMVLAFVPIWFAICARIFFYQKGAWSCFCRTYPLFSSRIKLFFLTLGLALLVLIINYGLAAWKVGVIGLISYLFPIIAIVVGFYFVRSPADFKRLIIFYIAITTLMLTGGLLQYLEMFPNWSVLGTEVLGMEWIRHVPGYIVRLNAGFYRSPDIMGWNAALLVMLSLLMIFYTKETGYRMLFFSVAVWGVLVLLISGRNKMSFMPIIFTAIVMLAYLYKGKIGRSVSIASLSIIVIGLFLVLNIHFHLEEEYLLYTIEGAYGVADRASQHGIEAVVVTYYQSGFFGKGLGSASTGARFGGAIAIKTWQEGGLSRLMVELGVLGLIASFLLGLATLKILRYLLINIPLKSQESVLYIGLLGIIGANFASFIVSHQVFGDPFIVIFSAFFLGVAFSTPRWLFALPQKAHLQVGS